MIAGIVAHLWQSTLFAGAAWLVTLVLRKNRAQHRYWVWFAASAKFLIPFSLLVRLGARLPSHALAAPIRTEWVVTFQEFSQPLTPNFAANIAVTTGESDHGYLAAAATVLWACGFGAIATCWLLRWTRVHALRKSARALSVSDSWQTPVPVMVAAGLIEPGILGVLRPVLLLPEGIRDRLNQAQLEAVLAHEFCHVRRKDNLTATIHMAVQAIFWFHPLTWWIGARLVDERERACDEDVVRLGSEPRVYAEGILNVCKHYLQSPLSCVAGVTGSNLQKRIEAIMSNRIAAKLNFPRKVALAVLGITALAMPILVGVVDAPAIRAQTSPAETPKFEVVSVKPCDVNTLPPGARSGPAGVSGATLSLSCMTVRSFIARSYVDYANGQYQGPGSNKRLPIGDTPAWTNSEHYTIEAKSEGTISRVMAFGPMLQAILEDRFKLRAHRETREVPIYEMTVAKAGAKLKPSEEGSCTPRDPNKPPQHPGPGQKPLCGQSAIRQHGPNHIAELRSMTMADLAQWLTVVLDRAAIDKTGIQGKFDLSIEFAPPGTEDAPDAGPSVVTAVQEQLGLKLVSAKGAGQSLVIDHVERPSEN
jgi:bla regulator protein BlaR1